MCGRYSITLPPEAIRQIFQTYGELPNWPAYYNAAPTTALPVVRQAKDDGNRKLALMQWGLVPWFSKDGKLSYSTINARAESVQTNASYREPFKNGRRCIVPASGYFEWTGPKNDRQPHYFTRADGQPIALAGLWDRWRSKDRSETKETFTIVTTEPSKFAAQFHNRMPLVLEPASWDIWMKGEPDAAAALMNPANEDALVSRPVSKAVGNVKKQRAGIASMNPPSDRNRAIAARRAEGATFKAIAAEFGVGPQRAKEIADRVARWDRGQGLLRDDPENIEGLHLAGQLPRLAFLSLEAAGIRRIADLDGMTLVDLLQMHNIGRRVATMLIELRDRPLTERS